ncbi:unnamed protein product [Staurois parvus]|uniref:Uncharacterized protein n=1 Tax=Staurois parvus TaxID=386267 RepID=A0ABN9DD80_9NEOB|nr:unnamed protein product [Staurois parvus]
MYTDQGTDDQCSPSSATCQNPSVPAVSVDQCQCTSMPHISAHLSCLSVSSISASQCHLVPYISAMYQCCLFSAHQ